MRTCIRGSSTRTSTAIRRHPGVLQNLEPLLVNLVDTWSAATRGDDRHSKPVSGVGLRAHLHRPRHHGRRQRGGAARGERLLDAVKFDGPRCELWQLHEPEILAPWRLHDAARYKAGLPWDDSLLQVAAHALRERRRSWIRFVHCSSRWHRSSIPWPTRSTLTDGVIEDPSTVRTVDPQP